MIEVSADNDGVHVTIPAQDMTAEEIGDFVSWLRLEAVARRSKMTSEEAWKLSEEIKSGWWEANQSRVIPRDS